MKAIAGMLVLWSAGVGLGAVVVLAGVSVRPGWRRRTPRLVAWGARRGDVTIGSWDDRMRVADQLIIAASRKLDLMAGLMLLQQEENRRHALRIEASLDALEGEVYVIGGSVDPERPVTWGRVGKITNIGQGDAA